VLCYKHLPAVFWKTPLSTMVLCASRLTNRAVSFMFFVLLLLQ